MATANTTATYTKAECPYCDWSGASHRTPHHLVIQHLDKVHLRTTQCDHFIYAYVLHKKEEHGFCYCLTCHKGTYDSGYAANSSRWVTMHAKKKECRSAHDDALKQFKEQLMMSVTLPTTAPAPPLVRQAAVIWEECKSKKALQAGMNKLEVRMRQEYEADSDNEQEYVFSADDAMRYAITSAVAFEKETDMLKTKLHQQNMDHEKDMQALRIELQATKTKCDNLQASYLTLHNLYDDILHKYNALIAAK